MSDLHDLVRVVQSMQPPMEKVRLEAELIKRFGLQRDGALLIGDSFAVRLSTVRGRSFSNTVMSFRAVLKYDHLPIVVCVMKPSALELLLANSSFIKRVSHSSHALSETRIRGSINGSDIETAFDGIRNEPANFEALFALHLALSREENTARIAAATSRIHPTHIRFAPDQHQQAIIMAGPDRAHDISQSVEYADLRRELLERVSGERSRILNSANVPNVNLRGRAVEEILTGQPSGRRLADIERRLPSGAAVLIDVKSKLLDRSSAPKAFNIDKLLESLADPSTAVCVLFVGIDLGRGRVIASLVSLFDRTLLPMLKPVRHWAGRGSRGVLALQGNISSLMASSFVESIDRQAGWAFLARLLAI